MLFLFGEGKDITIFYFFIALAINSMPNTREMPMRVNNTAKKSSDDWPVMVSKWPGKMGRSMCEASSRTFFHGHTFTREPIMKPARTQIVGL